MNINELREKVKNGDFDDDELIDLVLYLERENQALLEEIKKYKVDRDKTTKLFLNLNDFIKEEIKYCKEIGFECCVEELEKVLKEVE